jgi:hypothetical protein
MGHSRALLGHRLLDRFLGITDDPADRKPPRLDRGQNLIRDRGLAAGGQMLRPQHQPHLGFAHDIQAVVAFLGLHPIHPQDHPVLLKKGPMRRDLGRLSGP